MRAAEGGRLDQVRALLAAGADVDAELSHGHTALMLAAGEGHVEIVKVLLVALWKLNRVYQSSMLCPN